MDTFIICGHFMTFVEFLWSLVEMCSLKGTCGLLQNVAKLVRADCVRTTVVHALADVVATKLGIILFLFP